MLQGSARRSDTLACMALTVELDRPNDVTAILTLSGPLNLGTDLKIFDTQVQLLIEEGVRRLVLDLTACPYTDSSGLGVMVHAYGLIDKKGGAIRLCGVSERIASMLKMTHTDPLLPCDEDLAASLAALA